MAEEYDLVITNGVCVTATDVAPYDIAVKNEKILLLSSSGSLKGAKTKKLIDAEGGYVMVRNTPPRPSKTS
jgi:dihydropyrimidinase